MCSASGSAPVYSTLATTGKNKDLYLLVVFESAAGPSTYIVQTYEIDTQTAALATKPCAQHTLVCTFSLCLSEFGLWCEWISIGEKQHPLRTVVERHVSSEQAGWFAREAL